MNIQPNCSVNFQSSFYDRFFKTLPNKDVKDAASFNKLGQKLASPHWNRLVIGVTAMATQPAFDYFNPKVDNDTAKASMYRSIAKITACTGVGFCVRGACYHLTEKFANLSEKEGSTLLTPKAILEETNLELKKNMLKIHKNAFSTTFALGVMLFTNVLLDAPITTALTNKLLDSDKSLNKKQLEARA